MSVSLEEVIAAGGYDITTEEDARWLLSRRSEWEELTEKAEETISEADDRRLENELEENE